MSKKEFSLPPLSPLIGSKLSNYIKITSKEQIETKYLLKYFLTGAIISILSPLRWYEDWKYRDTSQVKVNKPVFILGHWRSGTTLLHNLLCQTEKAAFVSTYQTVFTNYMASKPLMAPLMNWLTPETRPSDNVKLHYTYPQEEEFALSNISEASFYNFFYFPKKASDFFERYISFSSEKDKAKWAKDYDGLLKKTSLINHNQQLFIKNPASTARLDTLRSLYPDARFIHIYRNPYTVFLSTMKFFKELMPTLWFQELTDEEIEKMVIQNYTKLMDSFYTQVKPDDRLIEIRFEELERSPIESLVEIFDQLDISGFKESKSNFEKYLDQQGPYKKNKYSISIREKDLVEKHWADYLQRWNYDLPDNMEIIKN
ncbi:sulfotransferase family protein [Echinicola shivajiensis]|uniref:sulfotransferase family protein n=1 Tax=Echinicola shivajiensis TaxID=1035916 RepID=UPI001BFC6A44|nr:sulfotransferase [Echinicola shivajiensis]